MTQNRASERSNFFVLILGILFVVILFNTFLQAYHQTLFFNGSAADGVFQIFNPLRRLDAGFELGRDFQFFHGIGTLLIHYPFFKLLGSTLFASELTRWSISLVLFQLGNFLLLRALRLSTKWALALTLLLFMSKELLGIEQLSQPANGLMGVRAFFPLAAVALLLWVTRFRAAWFGRRPDLLPALGGLLAAVALFFSTEHGVALWLGLLLTVALFPIEGKPWLAWTRLRLILVYVGASVSSVVLLFGLFAGRYALDVLQYNLVSVPLDQFWYFGGRPSPFMTDLRFAFAQPAFLIRVLSTFGLGYWLISSWRKRGSHQLFTQVEISILLGALAYGLFSTVANLGYFHLLYSAALWRVDILVLLGISYRPYLLMANKFELTAWAHWAAKYTLFVLVLFTLSLSFLTEELKNKQLSNFSETETKTSGVYLSDSWRETMATWEHVIGEEELRDGDVWSTYVSLLESEHDVFHPDMDYIIHALGPELRQKYLNSFIQTAPRFVQTMKSSESFEYGAWLENTTWGFFELVLENYAPIAETGHSIIWLRQSPGDFVDGREEGFLPLSYQVEPARLILDINPETIKEGTTDRDWKLGILKVDYQIQRPFGFIPLLGKLPRFLLAPENTISETPISLPPYQTSLTFGVFFDLQATEKPILTIQVLPALGANVEITGLSIKWPSYPAESEYALIK